MRLGARIRGLLTRASGPMPGVAWLGYRGERWDDYLEPDERLLWSGRPSDRLTATKPWMLWTSVLAVLFAVVAAVDGARHTPTQVGSTDATADCLSSAVDATLDCGPPAAPPPGEHGVSLAFAAATAVGFGAWPFILRAMRKRQAYALTSKRALILDRGSRLFRPRVAFWTIAPDAPVKLTGWRSFGRRYGSVRFAWIRFMVFRQPVEFDSIDDADHVHELLLDVRRHREEAA